MARRLADGPGARSEAVEVLRAGGIVAIPTDTVYGLTVDLASPGSLDRLFEAKGRPRARAIAVLLAGPEQGDALAEWNPAARVLAEALWPGGLTLVLARRPGAAVPEELSGGPPTPRLRVPDHPAPRALAAALGPLPTTSANLSGDPELVDADAIEAGLGGSIDLILDGGPAPGGPASTVVDVSDADGPPRILRAGAIAP